MDYQNKKSTILKKDRGRAKREQLSEKLELVLALKDVPLEDRREEAKKPLFLIRYE
ncbi:MAG: hypothetical protein ABSD92_13695 [Candidatus Bathyarchaeia archaeon]|jgi:hypothetical protein